MLHRGGSMGMWQRFVREGVLDEARIGGRIAESWRRCRREGVDPFGGSGRTILSRGELEDRRMARDRLLRAAAPYLEDLYHYIEDTKHLILLIDAEGFVLFRKGYREMARRADGIQFVEGARWTESEVGTNAIGTALATGEPIMVVGAEHYAVASHPWVCAAAPIRDDRGNLLGILDVSGPVEQAHPLALATVTAAAYAIERQLHLDQHRDRMTLLHMTLEDPSLSLRDGLTAVCDADGSLVWLSPALRRHVGGESVRTLEQLQETGARIHVKRPVTVRDSGFDRTLGSIICLGNPDSGVYRVVQSPRPRAPEIEFPGQIGESAAFRAVLRQVERVAKTDVTVCIEGETGTGKELVARAIHANSARRGGPFVAVNCGAIPEELLESELFGYVEGAFTGARKQGYKGKFEQAHGGTLFLDEIGDITPAMQVALLRVLQERRVTPLGSSKEVPVDVRVIAATHHNLREQVKRGRLREDLFYRLYVYPIRVPPLRERKEDIPHLVRYFFREHNNEVSIPHWIMEKWMQYDWPGNVRELFNLLERAQVAGPGEWEAWLPDSGAPGPEGAAATGDPGAPSSGRLNYREQIQKEEIMRALQETKGNVRLAAERLHMPRSTLYRRIQKFGL
ncbi:sigma-54-dependent Fis family transcriptional regulator [Kyrpidia spormannii]|uniref:Sigma-54-dependent Fis family transcriptional regulator n=1 Tax=Kyrpidia spormannii TaxID=2055160 RepID=A0A2K8N7D7_9BACL|nr:sigma-54-dependent Fis family transcriptional regulator [Kyrpidia spormannii]ATY85269.1 sigma-54-dependent Fis family transcriptional regulator [Kyrpidia spormannii]